MRDVLEHEPPHADGGKDVDEELAEKRKRRTFREEDWLYKIRLIASGVVAFLTLALLIVYIWHIAAPQTWRWLTAEDLDRLERLSGTVLAGVIASLSVSFFFKR